LGFFGISVTSSVGDLDGDGVVDLAVGALYDYDWGTNRGVVWLLFLNSDGTVKSHHKISILEGRKLYRRCCIVSERLYFYGRLQWSFASKAWRTWPGLYTIHYTIYTIHYIH
jgi:hypothetical protein